MGKVLNWIASAVSGLLIAGLAIVGFSNVIKANVASSYPEWMKEIPDETPIREVNMPGTHDSAAIYGLADLAGQCQSLSIEDQLNIGVRFLDIRLQIRATKLHAVHGMVDQKLPFKDIVSTVDGFLKKHPSEFLIVSVKEDASAQNQHATFEGALKAEITSSWRTEETLPATVGEARGKAVLLSRYANSTIGIPAYEGWKDSASFTLPNDIYVQDTYKTDVETKKSQITSCFNEAGHALKINFLSGYSPSGFPPSYAPSIARGINPWIDEEIAKYNDRGIVLYDFVTTAHMDAFFRRTN